MAENEAIKWYVIHTYSGYENKVMNSLLKAVENNGMSEQIVDVRIPTEEVVEIKNNKRRVVQRKLLPGYVLVKMEMTNDTWYVVRNTRGCTGFVGAGNKPTPLNETDFANVLTLMEKPRIDVVIGDKVRILAGLFQNFTGNVLEIDRDKQRVKIGVEMINKITEVDLGLDEVLLYNEE